MSQRAINAIEPPDQTPHSTKSPGISCRFTFSTASHMLKSRAGGNMVLALQLQQPAFEVSLLCGGLMSAPPSRPSNDEGWLNAPLRQSDRDAPDFLHRPGNRQAWR